MNIPNSFFYGEEQMDSIRFDHTASTLFANAYDDKEAVLFVHTADGGHFSLEGDDIARFMYEYKTWLNEIGNHFLGRDSVTILTDKQEESRRINQRYDKWRHSERAKGL